MLGTVPTSWLLLAAVSTRSYNGPPAAWPRGTPADWPAATYSSYSVGRGVRLVTTTWLNKEDEHRSSPAHDLKEASILECGWPLPALRARQWAIASRAITGRVPLSPRPSLWEAGIPVPAVKLPQASSGESRLPVEPVWPNFALNAAVLGAVLGALWHIPHAIRWLYRRRCGLCTACAFPAGPKPICTECGRRVRPWTPRGRPVRAYTPRRIRLAARLCLLAVAIAAALYFTSGWAALYLKGPGGWYIAVWQGQTALGRASTPFHDLGLQTAPHGGYRLRFTTPAQLLGSWACLPLWIPVPALIATGLAAWWHSAVRSGLAQHWPPPSEALPSSAHP